MKRQNDRGIFIVRDFSVFTIFQVVLSWTCNGGRFGGKCNGRGGEN